MRQLAYEALLTVAIILSVAASAAIAGILVSMWAIALGWL
jgi:hypothetical protein